MRSRTRSATEGVRRYACIPRALRAHVREEGGRAGHGREHRAVLVDRERRSDDAADLTDEDLAARPVLLGGPAQPHQLRYVVRADVANHVCGRGVHVETSFSECARARGGRAVGCGRPRSPRPPGEGRRPRPRRLAAHGAARSSVSTGGGACGTGASYVVRPVDGPGLAGRFNRAGERRRCGERHDRQRCDERADESVDARHGVLRVLGGHGVDVVRAW